MNDRRVRRSREKQEALNLLLEAVRERSPISSIALVDGRGSIVSGVGSDRELSILGAVARPVACGVVSDLAKRLTEGTDVLARVVALRGETMYLAALGEKVPRMHEVAQGAVRILGAA